MNERDGFWTERRQNLLKKEEKGEKGEQQKSYEQAS